ncbi:phytanoyl-CoA dioxygenase family protein [Flavobacteriaceae bacterium TP-CH-4]|uniref:Phytanoyl-CoA dioxygenase family protein n=1 Tax=Pelagihabitans pacificus TaxID=2696054 RepID=A0A967EAL6_9FLAO|nr:phytanoyl-CoA dioxygenase family protein [Pelagihabitans pacificus]NHF59551.1 phytanoyl-CoA dioxygenase family protein [Pelagihabitans pacificus]
MARIQNKNGLSTVEKKFYVDNGYLLTGRPLFNPKDFDRLYGIFEEHLENKGELGADQLDVPHFKDNRLFDFLMADEVLDVVEGLIGPNIGLWSSHFICKEPKVGKRTPWHEDSAYWKGRFDSFDKVTTVWLAIDPSFKENGCMGVIPGTHKNGFSEYAAIDGNAATFDTEIKTEVKEEEVVWFELEQGNYSLHDSRIIHGANANTSEYRRTGYTMRYFSTDLVLNREHPGNKTHKIYHCRGGNAGNNPLLYH